MSINARIAQLLMGGAAPQEQINPEILRALVGQQMASSPGMLPQDDMRGTVGIGSMGARTDMRSMMPATATPQGPNVRANPTMGAAMATGAMRRPAPPVDEELMGAEMEALRRDFERQPVDGKADRTRNQQEAFSLPGFNTTEGQVLGYTMRAAEANRVLNQMETQGTRWGQRAMEILPGNTENMLRDDEFQQYLNAEQNFLAAVLRRDTGAAITREEFDLYRPMFFPQPGDGPGVIEQKRQMRESALAAMAAGTAEGFSLLPQDVRGLIQPGGASPAPAGQPEPTHRFNPATGQIEAIQ